MCGPLSPAQHHLGLWELEPQQGRKLEGKIVREPAHGNSSLINAGTKKMKKSGAVWNHCLDPDLATHACPPTGPLTQPLTTRVARHCHAPGSTGLPGSTMVDRRGGGVQSMGGMAICMQKVGEAWPYACRRGGEHGNMACRRGGEHGNMACRRGGEHGNMHAEGGEGSHGNVHAEGGGEHRAVGVP